MSDSDNISDSDKDTSCSSLTMAGLSYLLLCSWRMWLWLLIWFMGESFTTGLGSTLWAYPNFSRWRTTSDTPAYSWTFWRQFSKKHIIDEKAAQPTKPHRTTIIYSRGLHCGDPKSRLFNEHMRKITVFWKWPLVKEMQVPPIDPWQTMTDSDYLIKLYQNASDNDIQPRITSYHFRWISYDLIISYFMIFMAFSFLLSYRLPTYRPTYRLTYWPTYLTYQSSLYLLFVCSHGSCALHIIISPSRMTECT